MIQQLSAPCPGENTLDALGEGRLSPAEREAVVRHIDACSACRRLLGALGAAADPATRPDVAPPPKDTAASGPEELGQPLAPGARLGRYNLLHVVGAGGMGVVYAAYDPQLDRRVAVKLLRRDRLPSGAEDEAAERLLREARALARLSHPNVIAVFDAGTFDGQVFLAMEFVEGSTLTAWLRAEQRPPEAVLGAFVRAGQGLAAAHAAGLVHRDFKPDNVLVDRGGRVRVTDFGLVRRADAAPAGAAEGAPAAPPSVHGTLTRTGAVLGTPAYMAPEQWRGQPADARSDQFSFCVALYEALHGERPYPAGALAAARSAPPAPPAPPRGSRAPERVRRALARGLSLAPEDRFPSMESLLASLEGARKPPRWLAAAAVGGALLLAGAAALATRQPPGAVCGGAAARLAGAWDGARRAEVRGAFVATGAPYAEEAARAAEAALDGYARGWAGMYTEACEATHARGEQSGELLDLRMACLGRRREALKALVDVLAAADARVVEAAAQAASRLPALDECASAEALTAPMRLPVDPGARARIDAARARLAEADAQRSAGRYAAGHALAQQVAGEAKALGYRPLEAEVMLALGRIEAGVGDAAAAEASLHQAVWAAQAGRHEAIAAEAAVALIQATGVALRRHAQAHQWAGFAEAAIERLGGSPRLQADRLEALGNLRLNEGHAQDGAAQLERALALREALLGREHPAVADTLRSLTSALVPLERHADAISAAERALSIHERLLGEAHPEIARDLYALAFARASSGAPAEAIPPLARALAIEQRAFGPDHPVLVRTLKGLGNARGEAGQPREALDLFARALAIQERATGPEHPQVADLLGALAITYGRLKEHALELSYAERALALHEKLLGPEHPDVVSETYAVGLAHVRMGHRAQALPYLERALALADRYPLEDARSTGRYMRTRILYYLAETLWETRRDRPRARALMTRALELCRGGGEAMKEDVEELTRWLSERPR
ncbi:protein kinase domain-containing protein [Sorangium sp. So ce542]|uniref:protein kinase domain-containing protein n=1 Tax=Sorangium sp. So ce542 TaxID=3133316 RepID=UPI003F5F02BC